MAAKDPVITHETREISYTFTETDFKFILAMSMIALFFIMMVIPLAMGNETLFKDVAAIMTGFVGTILGYYFGSKKEQPKE